MLIIFVRFYARGNSAKKKKAYGEKKYDGDKIALRSALGRGQLTANKNRKHLAQESMTIHDELSTLRLTEIFKPNFAINAKIYNLNKPVLSIIDGSCDYDELIVTNLNLAICSRQTLAVTGPNGSGKTTLAKAIMGRNYISQKGYMDYPKSRSNRLSRSTL